MNICRQHPLTPEHVDRLASLISTEIGRAIGAAALAEGAEKDAAIHSLDNLYDLRRVVATMQITPVPRPKAAKATRTRKTDPTAEVA